MKKGFALWIILILAVSCLIMIKPEHVIAQNPTQTPIYHKPTVPRIYLNLIVSAFVVNKTIELFIENQPFTPYYDPSSGWNISFYYNVQIKTNEDNWSANWSTLYTVDELPTQSNGNYTVFLYPSNQPVDENDYQLGGRLLELPPGTQIEFQVQAMIGYVHRDFIGQPPPYYFTGEVSGWSNTQTLTMPTSVSPYPTPIIPEFPTTILIITFLITATLLGTVVIKRKQSRRRIE